MSRKNKKNLPRRAGSAEAAYTPDLQTEVASRLSDPYAKPFMGVVTTNDPLLQERGGMGSGASELYRDLLRDGKVHSGLQKRKLAVIGREWTVEPATDSAKGQADAVAVAEILATSGFDRLCNSLLNAILMGWQAVEVIWGQQGGQIVPLRYAARAQRRFNFVQDAGDAQPYLHLLTESDLQRGRRVPERKFIVHSVGSDDDNPNGIGLGLQLYWPVFFKRKGVMAWNMLCERFGAPIPWGQYPNNALPEEKRSLFDGLRAMQTDGVIMTPVGAQIALIETKLSGGGQSSHQALCNYMDDWIMEVILGQPPRSGGGGALAAAANEREDVRLEISQGDSDLLSETLNDTLLRWICEFNGFEPCRVWRRIEKEQDTKLEAETDAIIKGLGFKPSLKYIQAKYGEEWQEDTPATTSDIAPISMSEKPAPSDLSAEIDPIDALIAAEIAQWKPVMEPVELALQRLLDDAAAQNLTLGELLPKLAQLLPTMPTDRLTDALTRSAFAAHLGYAAGLDADSKGQA